MIAFRKSHVSLQRKSFFTGEADAQGLEDISWHGCRLYQPGWNNPNSRVLAFTLGAIEDTNDIHVICNMDEQDLDFDIPPLRSKKWYRVIDTAQPFPHDIAENMAEPGKDMLMQGTSYHALSHSIVVLISR
jgi:isoamylase